MLAYAGAIFLSAFLVFQVQPIVAKAILPWFGGTPAVWTTCVLFFQVVLLLGYAYAHASIRWLAPRSQALVHVALLALALFALPISPHPRWKPTGGEDPVLLILGLLGATVGAPYALLSATAPLLQAWFARTEPGRSPYRLYALSNLGSMLALLTYPVGVEPLFTTSEQQRLWSGGFVAFALVCGICVLRGLGSAGAPAGSVPVPVASPDLPDRTSPPGPTVGVMLLWLALSACGSTMLLAVTNQMCQELTVVPFLWILPLSLYLLSFILCFESDRWYRRGLFVPLLAASLGAIAYVLSQGMTFPVVWGIPVLAGGLFVACMFCHGELAALRPTVRHLTGFYLVTSVGGASGGLFVGLAAPHAFSGLWELHFGLLGCAMLAVLVLRRSFPAAPGVRRGATRWTLHLLLGLFVVASVERFLVATERSPQQGRNFYGHLKVELLQSRRPEDVAITLTHGATNHGVQYTSPARRRVATTYYGVSTGVGLAFGNLPRRSPRRAGMIGLGTGTLATYAEKDDVFRFYEINPLVIEYASRHFTFLEDARERGATVEVELGDARLSLEREADQGFDLLVVDAFSSDSIPAHLLTFEAFAVYFRHLRPEGVLAVHISNRHLDLHPVVHSLASAFGFVAWQVSTPSVPDQRVSPSDWVLVTRNLPFLLSPPLFRAGRPLRSAVDRLWTDDDHNLYQLLK